MARRPNVTMRKRQRELKKAEKAEAKRAKRLAKTDELEDVDAPESEDPGEETADMQEMTVGNAPSPETAAEEAKSDPPMPAYCKVCKDVLAHTLVEKKAGSSKRVKCAVCGDEHPYRKTKPATRKKARKTKQAAADEQTYDSLIAGLDLAEANPYSMATVFSYRTLIDHPTFGVGVVARVLPDRKIEVLFPEGAKKVLAHSR